MLPKTIILGCNLHGEIPLDSRNRPQVTPLKMNYVIQLNAVAPGIANIATFKNYNKLSKKVDSFIEDNPMDWNESQTDPELLSYVRDIKELLVESNKEEREEIERTYKEFSKTGQTKVLEHMQKYIHTFDKSYKITKFSHGQSIPNKIFIRFSEEELERVEHEDYEDLDDAYFNKLFVYNTEDKLDIFELLAFMGHELEEISLFNLIDLLEGLEVENIILVDLSCEVFSTESVALTNRGIRATRRDLEQSKLRGNLGRGLKNRRSKKSRKYGKHGKSRKRGKRSH
jgi:hypothetical protein